MSVPNYYPKSAVVTIEGEFREWNSDGSPGVLVDPTVVIFRYNTPNGTTTSATYPAGGIVKDAVGRYHLNITASIVGTWRSRVEGDSAAEESYFVVNPSVFN